MVQRKDVGQVPRERFNSRVEIMVPTPARAGKSMREVHETDRDRCSLGIVRRTLHIT